ncbi:MAG: hypothetical protein HY040_16970 [Planctomycetes bacterium]|nr:hypothetical protein [Planctomycetota bacterium]
MSEPATLPEHLLPPVHTALSSAAMLELEHRVGRLENAVSDLQDTQSLENRVALKVMERLQLKAKDSEHAEKVTAESPRQSASPPHAFDDDPASLSRATPPRAPWLLVDMIASARLLWRMLFDRRHRLAWTTHLVVWACLVAILLSAFWFPLAWIPFVGSYLDKVLDLLLAYFIYMALSRETRRYRETLAAG